MDLLYPVIEKSGWEDNLELKYSIRSAVEFYVDLKNIYIVGYLPEWINEEEIIHVACRDPYTSNKDANIINKVIKTCLVSDIDDWFLRMSDDYYFVIPTQAKDLWRPYRVYDMKTTKQWKPDKWNRRLWNTYDVLTKRGLPTGMYDSHIPYTINKHWFPNAMIEYDYGYSIGYTINSLYFNSIGDCFAPLKTKQSKKHFVNSSPTKLDILFKDKLINMFPTKSKYEV